MLSKFELIPRKNGQARLAHRSALAKRLFETLQEEEPAEWFEYQLQKQKQTEGFLKPFNPKYAIFKPSENPVIKSTTLKNVEPNAPQNPFQIGIQSNIQDPSSSQRLSEKQQDIKHESGEKTIFQHEPTAPCPTEILTRLGFLEKYYNDKEKRYGGELYDILDTKLRIFNELCRKAGISKEYFHIAFSSMLKRRAQDYFFDSISDKNKFETHSNQLEYLSRWRNTTLKVLINNNPTKSKEESFDILVEQLRKTQRALTIPHQYNHDPAFREVLLIEQDLKLRDQLLSACQSIPECENALNDPKSTFEEVIAQIRNAMYIRTSFNSASDQYPSESRPIDIQNEHDQYWTDRTYNRDRSSSQRGRYRGISSQNYIKSNGKRSHFRANNSSRGHQRGNFRTPFQQNSKSAKTCWICKKPGCWSTNLSVEEQKEGLSKFQKQAHLMKTNTTQEAYSAFLVKWEGHPSEQIFDTSDEKEQDKINQYLFKIQDEGDDDDNEVYDESAYVISSSEPQEIIKQLENQSMLHALTKQDPLINVTAYTVETRYSAGVFQEILPDTGASGVSMAGESQFKALQQLIPSLKLKESRAGEHSIYFGKGSAISLGTIEAPTPF
ncbi:hypothetical protein GcM1_227070 [Golovinomyces cichoracearum]|uniref:Integrase and RNaseH domain-containing protein n=1 Tax=Golovinomyces cichoracearum TaxID=62708 RepID=A0A420IPH4_9PEZI|nr:hypothetical protein GcM1_227070 [Golovinomyces cichoracearum]